MPDYTSITVRKTSEEEYQKAKIAHEGKTGKKISGLDFFDLMVKRFIEVFK